MTNKIIVFFSSVDDQVKLMISGRFILFHKSAVLGVSGYEVKTLKADVNLFSWKLVHRLPFVNFYFLSRFFLMTPWSNFKTS